MSPARYCSGGRHTEAVATYTMTAHGPWPVNRGEREPHVGEMFALMRDGAAARSVLAFVPLSEFDGLLRDLEREGLNKDVAFARTRAVLQHVGAAEARRWAESGSLRHRDGDHALLVPVTLDLPSHRTLARSPGLPLCEAGDQIGEAFEVHD